MYARDLRPGVRIRDAALHEDAAGRYHPPWSGTVRTVYRRLLSRRVKSAWIEWDNDPGGLSLHYIGGATFIEAWDVARDG